MTPPVVAHYIIWQPEWQRTEERGSPGFLHRSQRNTNIKHLKIVGELGQAPPRLRKFTFFNLTPTKLIQYLNFQLNYDDEREVSLSALAQLT